jgi:hypothetical protein
MENVKILSKHENKSNDLNINEFDLKNMDKNPHIAIVAKRGSGHRWLVGDMLKNLCTDKTKISIISPTDKMSGFYVCYFPDADISYELDSGKIEKIFEEQTYNIKEKNGINQIVVFDDCLISKDEWEKNPIICEMLYNARHYHITYILVMQFPLEFPQILRCNFDNVFLLADDIIKNQKKMYSHYAGMFPNFEAFKKIYLQLTADYNSMVITNRVFKNNLSEKIFYYKPNFWAQNNNCDSDSDTESMISDDSEQEDFGFYLANPDKIKDVVYYNSENMIFESPDKIKLHNIKDVVDYNTESIISDDSEQEDFGFYLANPDKIKLDEIKLDKIKDVVDYNTKNMIFESSENSEESPRNLSGINSTPKQKVILLKEFIFKNVTKNPVYFIAGKNKKDRNLTIKKILDHYFSQNISKDITHIKNDTEYDIIKKVILQQDSDEKQNNHIIVFDDCIVNFESFSNKKKCALYELFLRRTELNLTIIIQTSDTCYGQLKEKSIPDFIDNAMNYIFCYQKKIKLTKYYYIIYLGTDLVHIKILMIYSHK